MKNKTNQINRIEFNSYENEIHVTCVVFEGNLSFETEVILSNSWFNPLLLFLQRENSIELLDEAIERIPFPDGSMQYSILTDQLAENNIQWEELLGCNIQPKRIRA